MRHALASNQCVGYGQTPRLKGGQAPIEHVFSRLNVFDARELPWLGVYRLDLRIAQAARTDKEAEVLLTIEGAEAVIVTGRNSCGIGTTQTPRASCPAMSASCCRSTSGVSGPFQYQRQVRWFNHQIESWE